MSLIKKILAATLVVGFSLLCLLAFFWLMQCDIPSFVVKISVDKDDIPTFDFRTTHFIWSQFKSKAENRYALGYFEIDRVDDETHTAKKYWHIVKVPLYYSTDPDGHLSMIQKHPDSITYGIVPSFWKVKAGPEPLVDGIYEINEQILFVKKGNNFTQFPMPRNNHERTAQLHRATELVHEDK